MGAKKSVWETLSVIDVNEHTEKKGKLTYLSWVWAWGTLKEHYPDAEWSFYTWQDTGLPYVIDHKSGYGWVQVTVAASDASYTETLPVLDGRNDPIEWPNAFQINTSIKRCGAKAIAMLGLGHYIYAGEDLPQMDKTVLIHGGEKRDKDLNEETQEATGGSKIAEVMIEFLPFQTTLGQLETYWTGNKNALRVMKQDDVASYERFREAFKKQRTTIDNEGGKAV